MTCEQGLIEQIAKTMALPMTDENIVTLMIQEEHLSNLEAQGRMPDARLGNRAFDNWLCGRSDLVVKAYRSRDNYIS